MTDHLPEDRYLPIEKYGVIGNLHTVALISTEGSIDYLPFMRIDSPTIFLKVLDSKKGGYFSIRPASGITGVKQFYLNDTNILITRFYTETGIAEVTDYMPVDEEGFNCAVIRQVKSVIGSMDLHMECTPSFDYGRSSQRIKREANGCLFVPIQAEQTSIRLTSNVALSVQHDKAIAAFTLGEEATCYFLLEAEHSTGQRTANTPEYIEATYQTTYHFWKEWVSKMSYNGLWKEDVVRSALVLKLLISHKYGAPVAAATFGLPEAIGGNRNWDYRYTWIRDAAFTMYVFMELGLYDEADKFIEWIKRQCNKDRLQLLYTVDGSQPAEESELQYLEGYKASQPVRIGNAATTQLQLDIYGELLDTVYIFVLYARPITIEFWEVIKKQVQYIVHHWKVPDKSIWEVRGSQQQFLHSRVMCWVALDRAIKIAEHCSFSYPLIAWREQREEIFQDIFTHFWNPEKQTFVQYKGGSRVDASMLLMPIVHFISPYSTYWQSTLKIIEKELVSEVLVYRYKNDDSLNGLQGTEGTFTICSFWYVHSLAKGGEAEKATLYFEKILSFSNHLGLFAEQIGINGQHLGNFPQAFTHLSLISAAIELSKGEHLRKKVLPPDNASKMV